MKIKNIHWEVIVPLEDSEPEVSFILHASVTTHLGDYLYCVKYFLKTQTNIMSPFNFWQYLACVVEDMENNINYFAQRYVKSYN